MSPTKTTAISDAKSSTLALRHLHEWFTQLSRLAAGWLPGVGNFEAKFALADHLWQDMQMARDLRTRLWELRVGKPEVGVRDEIAPLIKRLACAQSEHEFLAAIYLGIKPALAQACRSYLASAHLIWDAPSLPILERAAAQTEAQVEWMSCHLMQPALIAEANRWQRYAAALLDAHGGIVSKHAGSLAAVDAPPASTCLLPFASAARDARFTVQLGGFARPPVTEIAAHREWQFANYCQEMQAAESIASTMWEVDGMPWDFYFDLARHCHDEVRHTQLGIDRLAGLGKSVFDWPQVVGNYAWRQMMDPLRRYCTLTYVIEQDAFKLKNETYRDFVQRGDVTSAEAIMYDMIDETMHVRFGMRWVPELLKHTGEALSVDALVAECARNTRLYSPSPAQREYAEPVV